MKIWVISDTAESGYELISKAQEIGEDITAYLLGHQETADNAIMYGANAVKLMELPADTIWEEYNSVLAGEAEKDKPELILVSASKRGKTLAAQLAAILDCPCISEAQKLEIVDGCLISRRIVYGGLANKELKCDTFPLVITIAPHTFAKRECEAGRKGEISTLSLQAESGISLIERKGKAHTEVDLTEASIVVGVGRGFAEKATLSLAEELAGLLGGELGCTRPIAEDLHWLSEDRYIGISGQQIKPDLYLGAGISGQIQHVYGIRDAKVIVAINNNENAPIFKIADYYIVGDLEEVIPAMITALKKID